VSKVVESSRIIAIVGRDLLYNHRIFKFLKIIAQLLYPHKLLIVAPKIRPEEGGVQVKKVKIKGLEIVDSRAVLTRSQLYFMPNCFYELLRRKPAIICHWTGELGLMSLTCMLASKILRVPFVIFTWRNKPVKLPLPIKVIWKVIISSTSLIIAGTNKAKSILISEGVPSSKIIVMPEAGIDKKFFFHPKGGPLRKGSIKKTVLFTGRFVAEKGIYQILESIEKVRSKIRDIHFIFCGNGPERDNMINYVKKANLSNICTIKGWVSYDEMPKVYNSTDVFVYPSYATKSWEEQFGFALLEAMACGVPVITTKSGSIPEVVGNSVIIIEPKNSKKLAEAIIKVLHDEDLRKSLSEKGRKQAEKYSSEIIAKKFIKVIVNLTSLKTPLARMSIDNA